MGKCKFAGVPRSTSPLFLYPSHPIRSPLLDTLSPLDGWFPSMPDSAYNKYTLRNAFDEDLKAIPEASPAIIVDSALAHFFTQQFEEPMNMEIRIVPEFKNRRKTTIVTGSKEAMSMEKNKYMQPCVCKRQRDEEIQKRRLRMACDQVRRHWREVYPGNVNPEWGKPSRYQYDRPIHLYMPGDTDGNTSTSRPIATATVGGQASFNRMSIQDHVKAMRSRSGASPRSKQRRP